MHSSLVMVVGSGVTGDLLLSIWCGANDVDANSIWISCFDRDND